MLLPFPPSVNNPHVYVLKANYILICLLLKALSQPQLHASPGIVTSFFIILFKVFVALMLLRLSFRLFLVVTYASADGAGPQYSDEHLIPMKHSFLYQHAMRHGVFCQHSKISIQFLHTFQPSEDNWLCLLNVPWKMLISANANHDSLSNHIHASRLR